MLSSAIEAVFRVALGATGVVDDGQPATTTGVLDGGGIRERGGRPPGHPGPRARPRSSWWAGLVTRDVAWGRLPPGSCGGNPQVTTGPTSEVQVQPSGRTFSSRDNVQVLPSVVECR